MLQAPHEAQWMTENIPGINWNLMAWNGKNNSTIYTLESRISPCFPDHPYNDQSLQMKTKEKLVKL